MKLCGVEIPPDIEIPPLDAATKAELDELHKTLTLKNQKMRQRMEGYRRDPSMPQPKYSPRPTAADKPLMFSIEGLRQLPPWSRTRVLYILRDQVTD